MKKTYLLIISFLIAAALTACGNSGENEGSQESEELKSLDVEFEVPEKADAGETVELKAAVTYGDEKVKDADEVEFEYWEQGNEENSTKVKADNKGDGTYTAEITFDSDGIYEMYAHTTARDLHTMPKKSITIGEGAGTDTDTGHENGHHDDAAGHEHSDHTEELGIHFMEPEKVNVNQEIDLTVHLQMDNEPLMEASVSYEILNDNNSEDQDWVETKENVSGEYTGSYSFEEDGIYTMVVHIENDQGLHEHKEYQIEVNQ
ncbi:FixH family protein [Oceanobacillus sp. FSL K6-2867]|uniref:FixH family protein n=1 Tax=Oceanobacillus sp. FSL K6-2867 TaxID=2954748 RepID=UPI0030D8C351